MGERPRVLGERPEEIRGRYSLFARQVRACGGVSETDRRQAAMAGLLAAACAIRRDVGKRGSQQQREAGSGRGWRVG